MNERDLTWKPPMPLTSSARPRRRCSPLLGEARAYLAHPLLGPRLVLCTEAVLAIDGKSLHEIFGAPDDLKFRSSMTLFTRASDDAHGVFRRAIDRRCAGRMDERTLVLLGDVAN